MNPLFKYSNQSQVLENMVDATIILYRELCKEFKPTPSRIHYVFGPRDLSKVF